LLTIAAIFVIGGCSPTGGIGTGGAGADLQGDEEFVRDVAMKNMAEIQLSRMALDKATDANIKTFAQMMVDQHGAAGDKLKSLVPAQGMEWPAQLDDEQRETADELGAKQGADFDRDYVEAMIESHQNLAATLASRLDPQSLAEWKTAAAGRTQSQAMPEPMAMGDVRVRPNKSDNELTMKINQWAADTYPVAQEHLDTARRLENAMQKGAIN
jgi:putative membrane protein